MPSTLVSTPTTTKSAVSVGSTTPASIRTQRRCKTCGRPRAGHPRQGCPYSDSGKEPGATVDSPSKTHPVIRLFGLEERNALLNELHKTSKTPPVIVGVFRKRDIARIKRLAETTGFHACLVNVSGPIAEMNPGEGWLVLGQEERLVLLLKEEMECRRKDSGFGGRRQGKGSGQVLRAVAGGIVLGAVATVVALAFT